MASESKGADVETPELTAREADAKLATAMVLAQKKFRLSLSSTSASDRVVLMKEILAAVEEFTMAPFYVAMCEELGLAKDEALVARLQAKNAADIKALEATLEDAKVNRGETEVLDALNQLADYYAQIGAKEKALEMYLADREQKQSLGQRIDLVLKALRLSLVHGDMAEAKKYIEQATELIESGGDWDRRNRLKVYRGTYLLANRDFATAAQLFLDSVATFTCYEMYDYNTFVFYVVVVSLLALDRQTLRHKVVDSPDVLTCIRELPHAEKVLTSFYNGEYRQFFHALVDLHDHIENDRFIAPHSKWYLKEVRVKAYSQFLESYKSVTCSAMAATFGVSESFLDRELSRFISVGRIHAKIDKLRGIIETNRPDVKNAQYSELIIKGDVLLNSVQGLARMLSV